MFCGTNLIAFVVPFQGTDLTLSILTLCSRRNNIASVYNAVWKTMSWFYMLHISQYSMFSCFRLFFSFSVWLQLKKIQKIQARHFLSSLFVSLLLLSTSWHNELKINICIAVFNIFQNILIKLISRYHFWSSDEIENRHECKVHTFVNSTDLLFQNLFHALIF